jgi:hypothetical protein
LEEFCGILDEWKSLLKSDAPHECNQALEPYCCRHVTDVWFASDIDKVTGLESIPYRRVVTGEAQPQPMRRAFASTKAKLPLGGCASTLPSEVRPPRLWPLGIGMIVLLLAFLW